MMMRSVLFMVASSLLIVNAVDARNTDYNVSILILRFYIDVIDEF